MSRNYRLSIARAMLNFSIILLDEAQCHYVVDAESYGDGWNALNLLTNDKTTVVIAIRLLPQY